jgi:hypothetical protein
MVQKPCPSCRSRGATTCWRSILVTYNVQQLAFVTPAVFSLVAHKLISINMLAESFLLACQLHSIQCPKGVSGQQIGVSFVEHAGRRGCFHQAETYVASRSDGPVFDLLWPVDHAGRGAIENHRFPARADSGFISGQRAVERDQGKGRPETERRGAGEGKCKEQGAVDPGYAAHGVTESRRQ